jgi:hypothetical protein
MLKFQSLTPSPMPSGCAVGLHRGAVNDFTAAVSPYDVINVQHVARRLLLENTGFLAAS